ncbi:OmpA family protein [Tumidithrix elongata RA019]|uniref:OmpA family protein n=1 Tax=Tumidithrix elongata BACA0141 TaxID=2716417 RepID=A0AAW9Q026_9CYAN|nr:OmpA family protein [Tumidithrix elongata RA019]
MKRNQNRKQSAYILSAIFGGIIVWSSFSVVLAQSAFPSLKIRVNSNADGLINPDDRLTLREAIALANGTLNIEKLSAAERANVTVLNQTGSQIEFALPADQTTIRLTDALPAIVSPNLFIDGTSQEGYDSSKSFATEVNIPTPVVAITPADNVEILRGITITADRVTVKGLSIYGFSAIHTATTTTPPADIFISHRLPPPDTTEQQQPAKFSPFYEGNTPPKGVVLEANWLGIPPTGEMTQRSSAFGVSIFNGVETIVQRNRIGNHQGSGIITSVTAVGSQILDNAIIGNGLSGIPDAIRLEGEIDRLAIKSNLICGNDGSAIFLFKPSGSIKVTQNAITGNGRGLRRAAIYLMGNDHQVSDNRISHQAGSGVAIAAFPKSDRNLIRNNLFATLEGMSIDLVTRRNTGTTDFHTGDGVNAVRDSHFRRVDTANGAINAPIFLATEFYLLNGKVGIDGTADVGSEVDLYRVNENNALYGPLNEYLTTVKVDDRGKFAANLENVKAGDTISAIATDPEYGTSEPARNARIAELGKALPAIDLNAPRIMDMPSCTTPPVAQTPPPAQITLKVPRQIHFALDRDEIGPASAKVLDRIAEVLQQYATIVIDLEGHTDPRAGDDYNLDLGLRRARSARNYLLRRGVAPERMTIRTQGERQPATQGNTVLDYARDRRVEVTFQDVRGIEIQFESQEEDLQLEKHLKAQMKPTLFLPYLP